MSKRHYLFTDEIYESDLGAPPRFDYPIKTVEKVIYKWCENLDYIEIAESCRLTEIECLLLLLDLQMTGKLPKRARDFYGRKLR